MRTFHQDTIDLNSIEEIVNCEIPNFLVQFLCKDSKDILSATGWDRTTGVWARYTLTNGELVATFPDYSPVDVNRFN